MSIAQRQAMRIIGAGRSELVSCPTRGADKKGTAKKLPLGENFKKAKEREGSIPSRHTWVQTPQRRARSGICATGS